MADPLAKLIVDVDEAELGCRYLETASLGEFKRPEGLTAVQVMSCLESQDRERSLRVARAATKYFEEARTSVRVTEVALNIFSAIDEAELMCRLIEAASDGKLQRPEGLTAIEAISPLQSEDHKKWLDVARAATKYISECMAMARPLQL